MLDVDGPVERSDAELVDALRRGEEAALVELWRRHHSATVRISARLVGNADAEDLAQEAMLGLWRAAPLAEHHLDYVRDERGPVARLQLLGPEGTLLAADAPAGMDWQNRFLYAPAIRIAGGSNEVQRNIMGERVLGLPREPQVDRDVPFRDLARRGSGA